MEATPTQSQWSAWTVPLLAVAALFTGSGRAGAQPVIVGRILIGGPSDNGVDTGQAYYPGGNGFVPGYGNYPDYLNDPQIVINFWKIKEPHMAPPPPADPDALVPEAAAVLRIHVPADAEVWFSENATTQRGPLRRFVTPALHGGRNQGYEIRARWLADGKAVERLEVVRVHPGDRLTVDFLAPSP